MYARLVMFTIGPGKRPTAERIADQFSAAMQGMPGFEGVTFFVDNALGEYGALSLWASQEDADAAGETMTAGLKQALEGLIQEPPVQRIFELYEPQLAAFPA